MDPRTTRVGDLLDPFLAAYGHGREGYASCGFVLALGPLRLPLPNPGHLPFHDLHHIAIGAGQDTWGEIQVSAFELRTGAPTLYIRGLCVAGLALGVIVAPLQVRAWWRQYAGCRNLYDEPDYEALLALDLDSLRQRMGLL
jgi:hypothetical protein